MRVLVTGATRFVGGRRVPALLDAGHDVTVLAHPGTAGETYEIGGPEPLSYEEMLRRTARLATGREPLTLPVPVLSPYLSTYWVDLVTDVPASVAHPLILGSKNPVDADDGPSASTCRSR